MFKKSLLVMLLMALFAPLAMYAQKGETLTFDFEDQAIPSTWTNDATYAWVVTDAAANGGTYSIKSSNEAQATSTSSITATFTFVGDGTISFAARCSCEQTNPSYDWDYGTFYIDGVQQGDRIVNSTTFSNYSYDVEAGTHTFKWTYKKDGSVNGQEDTFYVDDVVVNLGDAAAFPKPTDLTCLGTTANSAELQWTENGTATAWQIMLNEDESNLVAANTNPFTLTGLTEEQTYTARVRAVNGSDYSAWSNQVSFEPSAKIIIGSGATTNAYLPTYTYYNYSLTQQIFTAAELGQAAAILAIDFFCSGAVTRNLDIYMVSTTKTEFTGTSDWITVTDGDLVFSGNVTFTAGAWTSIELTNAFVYDGVSNVAIIVDDNTGSYVTAPNFKADVATNAAIRIYSDGTNYDALAPTSYTGTVIGYKNQIRILPGLPPTCFKPRNLAVGNITGRTADLTWTPSGEETAWQICLNDDENDLIDVTTTSYTLTRLEPSTAYTVKVRANCGDGDYSDFTDNVPFTTDVACPAPTNMSVTDVTSNSAVVSWDGDGSFDLRYGTIEASRNRSTLEYDFEDGLGDWTTIDADGDGFTWTLLSNITDVTTSYTNTAWAHGGDDAIFSGSYVNGASWVTTDPDNLLISPMVALGGSISFYARGLDGDYPEHFGVCVSTASNTNVADFQVVEEFDTDEDTEYHLYTVDLGGYSGYGYVAIRDFNVHDMYIVIIDDVTIEEGVSGEVDWNNPITGVTSPYTLSNLQPGTPYAVQVRANCGEDGYSEWVQRNFTTKGLCDVPTALVSSDVTAFGATLSWNGAQELYHLQYRTAAYRDELLYVSFDEDEDYMPEGWTNTGAHYWWQNTDDGWVFLGYSAAETQYLITSDLSEYEDADLIEFKQRYYGSALTFKVGFSTTTNDVTAFTFGDDIAATASETPYSVEIPLGAKYFAIQATTTTAGEMGVIINDFRIYSSEVEAGRWTEIEDVTSPYVLDGELEASTPYEWQVAGVNDACDDGLTEWSEIANFTTTVSCEVPTDLDVDEVTGTTAVLSWTSEAASFDIQMEDGTIIEGVTNPYTLEDLEPETIYYLQVRANCGEGDYSDWSEEIGFYTACTGAKDIPYSFGFDSDKLGEYYACWFAYSYSTANSTGLAYDPADNSNIVFRFSSFSQDSDSEYDQILISPELTDIEAPVKVSFDYKIHSTSYPESFSVYYTTENYTSLEDFELVEDLTAENADEFITYSATLPAGTKYVMLYYSSYYAWYLYIDNFLVEEAPAAAQVTDLTEGWNWFSTYIEITDPEEGILMLEESLGENGEQIKNSSYYTNYEDEEWFGDLDDEGIVNEQMYKIKVSTDCTVTLEGDFADPADHPITITNGWNWIGFPVSEVTLVEDAFANFVAEEGDQLKNSEDYTNFEDGEWFGDIEEMEPGRGYMYNYNGDDDQDLIFGTGAKVRRAAVNIANKAIVNTTKVIKISSNNTTKGEKSLSHPTNKDVRR